MQTTGRTGFIRVPKTNDCRVWRQVVVPLNNPINQYTFSSLGWRFIFIKASRPSVVLAPNTLPCDSQDKSDFVLAAMVVLPETDGDNQYWIPVTEKFLFALLETKEWTVFVQRDPITSVE